MAAFSAGLSAKVTLRFGIREPLWIGLLLVTAGLVSFSFLPTASSFARYVLPGMLLLGLGSGLASTPLMLAAMSRVGAKDSGIASGIVNTSFVTGGALGLAILATLANLRTEELQSTGTALVPALAAAYHLAFEVGALLTATAAIPGALLLRREPNAST
jgi:MFS family permease